MAFTQQRLAGLQRALKDPTHRSAANARAGLAASWLRKAQELHPDATPAEQEAAAAVLKRQHYVRMSAARRDR